MPNRKSGAQLPNRTWLRTSEHPDAVQGHWSGITSECDVLLECASTTYLDLHVGVCVWAVDHGLHFELLFGWLKVLPGVPKRSFVTEFTLGKRDRGETIEPRNNEYVGNLYILG